MTDQTQANTQIAVAEQAATPLAKVREYRVVESAQGIMDTARFEHLGRVATLMARAGLLPQTLTHFKNGTSENAPMVELPFEVVQARAYLIANQADLWKADPMAVAQCTSLVHGKLMYEGKLVHGIISSRLGVDLRYVFGRYDIQSRDIVEGEMPKPDDQSLGVRVIGTLPGEEEPRIIAGSVGMWHKGAKSPWGAPTAWPRQLRYMGAREWARAHKPSLLLGIMTEDEVDEYDLGRQVGAIAPAAPQMLHSGFSDRRPAQIEEGPKPPRAPKKREAKTEPDLGTEMMDAIAEAEPEIVAQVVEDHGGGTAATTEAAAAEEEGAVSSTSDTTETSPEEPLEEPTDPAGTATTASPSDEEVSDFPGDRPAPQQAPVDTAPAPKSDLPPEFKVYIDAVENSPTFVDVKKAMAVFYNTDLFKGMSLSKQNRVRADTYDLAKENGLSDLPDPSKDVSVFRLWIEWSEDPKLIQTTLDQLEDEEGFSSKKDDFKGAIRKAAADRIADLETTSGGA